MATVERGFTVAVLADVHGNMRALEAVLADLKRRRPDEIVFAGDLVMNGPHPEEVLATVMQSGRPAVMGNTDDEVIASSDSVAQWTRARIGAEGVAYLQALPLSYRTPRRG